VFAPFFLPDGGTMRKILMVLLVLAGCGCEKLEKEIV